MQQGSGTRLGYFVPEEQWAEIERANETLGAIRGLAKDRGTVTVNSDSMQSLLQDFETRLKKVVESGRLCKIPR